MEDAADAAPVAPRRPVVVTAAIVLIYLSGLSNIAVGILVLLSRYQQTDDASVVAVSLLGAAIILFGLLTIAIASAIARGSRLARLLLTIYLVVQLVLHVVTIVTTDPWDWTASVQLALDALTVVALWAPRGSRAFFAKPAPAA
jgi:holin-like protein